MRILIVSTGDTCRGPMAEALLLDKARSVGLETLRVSAAGLCAHPDSPMSGGAMRELGNRGIPFYRTRAVRVTRQMAEGALVLCMTGWQAEKMKKLLPDAQIDTINHYAGLTGDIADPYGGGEPAYRRAADLLDVATRQIVQMQMRRQML